MRNSSKKHQFTLLLEFTPLSSVLLSNPINKSSQDAAYVAKYLPPIAQAREFFDYFAQVSHLTFGVHHIPSTRKMMEQTYQIILDGKKPLMQNLLLLFTIFASASLGWTPYLLQKLESSQAEVEATATTYTYLAFSILDDTHQPLAPSTAALEAMCSLVHLLVHSTDFLVRLSMLRIRFLSMAREMNIHRLDTAKSREERRLKGCNMIEIEVQRRVWWSMVASDWYICFICSYFECFEGSLKITGYQRFLAVLRKVHTSFNQSI